MRVLQPADRRGLVLGFAFAVLVAAGASGRTAADDNVRAPAMAGQFYPAASETLNAAVQALLADAKPPSVGRPLALVLPHAGYVYSGPIAADGFRQAAPYRYGVVVLLGTNHTGAGRSRIALSPASAFRTPLGDVAVDRGLVEALLAECPDCALDAAAHAREHSIEVQLPFVQQLFPDARILPVVVNTADLGVLRRFGSALAKVLSGRDALIVASSDLSHYPAAADAERVDARTLEAVAALDPEALQRVLRSALGHGVPNLDTAACGEAPVLAALVTARALGATHGAIVSYAHSGRTLIGDSGRVVGYGAVALLAGSGAPAPPPHAVPAPGADRLGGESALGPDEERQLVALAREAIRRLLTTETLPLPRELAPALRREQGVFVTLRKQGELRGCVGRLRSDAPVGRLVGTMAIGAAFSDPRFPPVAADELPALEIEVSLLTPMHSVASGEDVVLGRDGVTLEKDGKSAVFLPEVATEQGWGRRELLDNLCWKAGLAAGCWREGAKLAVFEARVIHDRR
jgi:AmmeMemoRadiSam system protein B/AmmeMemoRadiSam system protein A